jgi:hypothetical protein
MKGEEITKCAIRVVPDNRREKLDIKSRINYAKVYTVEHNVKVCWIGKVAREHEQQLIVDYNATHPALPDRPVDSQVAQTSSYPAHSSTASAYSPYSSYSAAPGTSYGYPGQASTGSNGGFPKNLTSTNGYRTSKDSYSSPKSIEAPYAFTSIGNVATFQSASNLAVAEAQGPDIAIDDLND